MLPWKLIILFLCLQWCFDGTYSENAPVPAETKTSVDKENTVSVSRLPDANNTASATKLSADANSTKPSATTVAPPPAPPPTNASELSENDMAALPVEGSAEQERLSSLSIFFVLSVVALCIVMIHIRIKAKFEYFPESIIVVLIGALVGLLCKIFNTDCKKEEAFSPTAFFLVLLPPIIFESGYNLHKGNFFQNIGSILVFAIFGTFISAFVVGGGVYILGLADVAYPLSFTESFAFGSLISAVDPVATLAIFHALDVDPVLNMLVFGESILNDAVSIVLTNTVIEAETPELADYTTGELVAHGISRFCVMFFASAFLGVLFGLVSALLLKYVALRKNLSLELGMMLMFCYAPYALAEGLHLSGIMAILFCGISMSHYTHYNLSPVTQITMQQIFRTLALIAENCVFAYLGLAIFSFPHIVKMSFIIWSLALILLGRAVNIFPLSWVLNHFRTHKITPQMMAVMWFSGLRGAIAYALSLHLEFDTETRRVLVTTTLIIVLITIICLGGATMPLMKFLDKKSAKHRPRRKRKRHDSRISLSKTKEIGKAIDSEHLSELTEEEYETKFRETQLSGFALWDVKYFTPFFTRRFTQQDVKESKSQMAKLTEKWYEAIRMSPSNSEEEAEELVQETLQ